VIYLKIIAALLTPILLATIYWSFIKLNFGGVIIIILINFIIFAALITYSVIIFGDRFYLILLIGWVIAFITTIIFMFILGYALPNEGRDTSEWLLSLLVVAPACIIAIASALITRPIMRNKRVIDHD